MEEILLQYLRENKLVAFATPFYVVIISLEVILSSHWKLKLYTWKETAINLWFNLLNTIIGLSIKIIILSILSFFYMHAFFYIENNSLYWVLLFFLLDFCFYVEHTAEHYIRLLWAVHVTHHSSMEYNLTTGFRSSVFRPFVSFWFFIPLCFLGFQPLDILLMDAICQIYGILVHTQFIKKMPAWFESIFVSPSHHRVHHASNIIYLDKNMGMVLILWDKIFGTFQKELSIEKPVYGLTKNPSHPHHPFKIIFHEWLALIKDIIKPGLKINDRIKYLYKPPGWSHDGSTKTAVEMRKEIEVK